MTNHAPFTVASRQTPITTPSRNHGEAAIHAHGSNHGSNHGNHAAGPFTLAPLSKERGGCGPGPAVYDRDLVDALCRNVIGQPAAVCDWRELLRVRDTVDELLNAAVNRLQNVASTSPAAAKCHGGSGTTGTKARERDFLSRSDLACADLPGAAAPVVAPGSTTSPTTSPRVRQRRHNPCP